MAFSRRILPPLALFSLALTQCASEETAPPKMPVEPRPTDAMVPASGEAEARPLVREQGEYDVDRQIAMASDAFHTAAIDQAKLAYPKTKDAAVKRFAQTMLAEHGRAKQEETELFVELRLSPMESALSTEIGVESGKVLVSLSEASSQEFDDTYVAAQISLHQRFLNALDRDLLPAAGHPRLRKALEAMRPRIELHLDTAQSLQQALANP
jgi:putative membrane protein